MVKRFLKDVPFFVSENLAIWVIDVEHDHEVTSTCHTHTFQYVSFICLNDAIIFGMEDQRAFEMWYGDFFADDTFAEGHFDGVD